MIGWVCGRGYVGIDFEKGVWMGEHDRVLLGKQFGVCLGWDMEVSWEIYDMDSSWAM